MDNNDYLSDEIINKLTEHGWSVVGDKCYHEFLKYPECISVMDAVENHNSFVDYFSQKGVVIEDTKEDNSYNEAYETVKIIINWEIVEYECRK